MGCCYEGCGESSDEYVVFTPINAELGYCSEHADVVLSYFAQEIDVDDLWSPREKSLEELEGQRGESSL